MDVDVRPRAYHGLEVIDNMVYMVGGFDGNEHFNSVRCFDPVNKVWSERACMYTPRCYVSTCVLGEISSRQQKRSAGYAASEAFYLLLDAL